VVSAVRPLTILFTYYDPACPVTRVHWALLRHHNPGVPVVPLVANGAPAYLPGTVDVGVIADPMYNVDRFPVRWWASPHRIESERVAVVESDCLVAMPLIDWYAPAWGADVAAAVVATPDSAPGWEWWPGVAHVPREHQAGVMPSGVVLYSPRALDALAATDLRCMAEVRIGTAARLAGLRLAEVPGMRQTVHCRPELIQLSSSPGVYHPVKCWGGPREECSEAHEYGLSLLRGGGLEAG
jgi:hypothetical protein